MVRGRGYLKGVEDIESIGLMSQDGVPLLLSDVAKVEVVGDERRGIAELNGDGEVASGIVLQRFGENALTVIENAKKNLEIAENSLPGDAKIVPVYDRSRLIEAAIETLKSTLVEESIVVALVTVIFLLHVRSALVAIIMLPVGILMAFIAMRLLGLGSNIMSLGGIAIGIGAMIDNAHKHLERAPPDKPRTEVLIEAASEVGPALFFSLLIITVSFLPIFTLESQEGRRFGPLAFTKTFAMAAAAVLSVTLVPALMVIFVRGRIVPERRNPVNRVLVWLYRPVISGVLKAAFVATVAFPAASASAAADPDIFTVYKDPNCGCCSLWADAYKKAGYQVEIVEERDLISVKKKLGVPLDIQGCHTAVYRGQSLEGHVPLEAARMLEARSDLVGLVVPGMPSGSLGMGDDPSASYDVIFVGKDDKTSVFLEVRPKT